MTLLPLVRSTNLWGSLFLSLFVAGCATTQSAESISTSLSPTASTETTLGTSPKSASMGEEALWERLMVANEETYIVLLRHAIAPGTGDPENFQLNDCSTQRNLSEAGRRQAKEIGEAFRRRNIPVAQVLSSQWCRCLETAELMNVGPVKPFPALNSFFRDRSIANAQINQVKEYAIASRDSPGVIIMVTHQVNITALSGIFPQSGSAVVVHLDKDGQLDVIGQLLESSP